MKKWQYAELSYDCAKTDADLLTFMTKVRRKTAVKRFMDKIRPYMPSNEALRPFVKGYRLYTILATFSNLYLNKELVKDYDGFDTDGGSFPRWAELVWCANDSKLYVRFQAVHYCPNWNNERETLSILPLEDIKAPIISDIKGVQRLSDLLHEIFAYDKLKKIGTDLPDYGVKPSHKELEDLINKGMRCVYRRGWAYRGAKAKEITTEKALSLLPNYSYNTGFYHLKYSVSDNVPTLEFNELSVLDME